MGYMNSLLPVYARTPQFSIIAGECAEGKRSDDNATHGDDGAGDLKDDPWPVRPSEDDNVGKNAPHQGECHPHQPVDAPAKGANNRRQRRYDEGAMVGDEGKKGAALRVTGEHHKQEQEPACDTHVPAQRRNRWSSHTGGRRGSHRPNILRNRHARSSMQESSCLIKRVQQVEVSCAWSSLRLV